MSRLLQTAISERAGARPEAPAVLSPDGSLTYGELETASNRLAHALRELGCRRGDRVGLLMPKVPAAIAGLLGVLKADAAYVPLDPAGPPARLARMLEICGCHSILAAGRTGSLLRAAFACANLARRPLLGWLDAGSPPNTGSEPAFTSAGLPALPATPPPAANRAADLAHILFTSGSTGAPKGVMITHDSVLRFLEWAWGYFRLAACDRVSQHPPLHFDLSTFDIFGTLGVGAQLHLMPPDLNLLPHKLAHFIRSARLTQWFSVPSVLNLLAKFDVVRQGDFPELRRVIWCGEVIPTPTLIHWMRRLPHVRFTNLYGPTEATIASSHYTLPRPPAHEQEPIPIGTACAGEELLILDSALRPVADGEIGDLYIRGVGLSPGYWSDLEKTQAAFLPYPAGADRAERIYRTGDLARRGANGLIYFAGRKDHQIKSRGYRIELGEIETALSALPELRESAVVAVESPGFEGWMICCAYVPVRGASLDPQQLRPRLSRALPGYMLPARWMRCGALPRNANGKVDHPDLRRRFLQAEQQFSHGAASATSRPGGALKGRHGVRHG
jgi:amino acid adenylation domain-containing protein